MKITLTISDEGFELLRRPEGVPVERVKLRTTEESGVYVLSALVYKSEPEYRDHPDLRVDDTDDWGGTRK